LKRKLWKCTHCEEEYDYEVIACDKCGCPLFTVIEVEDYEI